MCTRNHCGPMVTKWSDGFWMAVKTRALSAAIPDKLWGIDFSPACKAHDGDYGKGGTYKDKKFYDVRFSNSIYNYMYKGLMTQGKSNHKAHGKATLIAWLYYRGVRTRTADKQFNWRV